MCLKRPVLLVLTALLCLCVLGCAGAGGDVVKVAGARQGDLTGLKKEDRAKLEEIRKAQQSHPEIDQSLSNTIQRTSQYSVSEYLMKHPEVGGKGGLEYRVGGYDVLSITVYEEKDLTRDAVRVSADGYITFPLISRVYVNDLTTSEIEKLISNKLAQGQYLLDAHVSVMVTDYKSKRFLVLGGVKNPGAYPLQAQERVLDGISKAGGVPEQTGKKAVIIRTENPDTPKERKIVINIDLQGLMKGRDQISNLFLTDRDVVFVPAAENFYIIGEVKKPGAYPIPEREITLVEAISIAGGFTPIASRNRTRIIRVEDGVEKIIEVKVDAITDAGKKIQDVIIQPNDVIVVPESFF